MRYSGKAEIRIEALNHGRILSAFREENITVTRCKKNYKLLVLSVELSCLKAAEELLKTQGYTYVVSRKTGFFPTLLGLLKRWGLLLGAVAAAAVIIIYSLCYFEVKIIGVNGELSQEIQKVIREDKLERGWKSGVDLEAISAELDTLEGVALTSVYFKGSRLVIDCLSELQPKTEEPISYEPITAEYDAVITRIVVKSGYTKLKVGDTVKKGDVLIYPAFLTEEEQTVDAPAVGQVFGRVWLCEEIMFYPQRVINQRTGEKTVKRELTLRGKTLMKKGDNGFALAESEVTMTELSWALPLILKTTVYYEIKPKTLTLDFESEKDLLIQQALSRIESRLDSKEKFLRSWNITKVLDKMRQISIYYEIERQVSA